MAPTPAVDTFVTPLLWPADQVPEFMRALMSDLFHRDADEVLASRTAAEVLAEMDAAGISTAVLNAVPGRADELADWVAAHPDRFLLSAEFDPRQGMKAVREIRRLHDDCGLALVRIVPFMFGIAPNHAAYYPLFAACVDLGLPASVTCGMPGPPMPAEVQRPLHLDDVCRYFPELTLIMAHGADPWWDEAIRLMIRFPNLHMMTSDCAPRYLPAQLIHYLNTRGRKRLMFATGFPVLDFARCRAEAEALDLRPGVLDDYLRGNAERLFGLTSPTHEETA
ncbi:MAG TPA: amidohydrolase family protein [Baekduia sp.]|uniref:amidohydrolase family protein n=1 Tax=Baekduia sp. TaxID=2600305 RepID=UPI002B80A09F|nr:amidohydrolase family protein [Baekduia sp.]HMJ37831.1 amidohydrolase family protein [Baekduia sp.]